MILARLRHIRERRKALIEQVSAFADFETWKETCVPSYCHPKFAAAYVSWRRLFAAIDLASAHTSWGPVLDFGASVGELRRILPEAATPYEFIEQEEPAARYLLATLPDARRRTLDSAPEGSYACVFALDALEHNTNYPELIARLAGKLSPSGVLVISGPSENALYRLGRRSAGFDAHYHHTNIDTIEEVAEESLTRIDRVTIPFGIPLFRISAWKHRSARRGESQSPPGAEPRSR